MSENERTKASLTGQSASTGHLPCVLGSQCTRDSANPHPPDLYRSARIESLEVVAGGIAHDFNNLLTAILGGVSLAQREVHNNPRLAKRLRDIEGASKQARSLTQQLLEFAKGTSPQRGSVQLDQLVHEALSFALHGTNCLAQLSVSPGLWSAEVDSGQIHQVLNNLILNAAQAMPDGGTISIHCENVEIVGVAGDAQAPSSPNPHPGRYVRISITDEGAGISEERIGQICEPFFTTKQNGTGLGLTTSRAIVREHCGELHVESEVGKGSTFSIYLPATSESVKLIESSELSSAHDGGRILIVDDEELVLETATSMLEYLSYTVVSAYSGAEALAYYAAAIQSDEPFDAVVIDLTIPGEDGGEAILARLRQLDPGVKAIVSSGYANSPVLTDFQRYGFRAAVVKPYELSELGSTLQRVIKE